ncbi:MAG: hypothetical protein LBH53_03345 [Puniceicoccales bacterium]|nr:hypothetical protein [Puniceicoccales bacterium]
MRRCIFRKFSLLSLLLCGAFLTGCAEQNPDDSQLPWARPGKWEGTSFTAAKARP